MKGKATEVTNWDTDKTRRMYNVLTTLVFVAGNRSTLSNTEI